ncbi:MAG TPA: AAA family ATPase, partial [Acidimicrobiia bacterium]|nr:AAA family ATPase [Acidimicrobiia bacterium]
MREPESDITFAGRGAELDLLCGALGALGTTGARTVLIGGEAGIGKTRLIEEFRDRARAAGSLVAIGVCTPAEGGGLPYGPVVGVLRDLSRQLDEATVAAILAPVRRRLGLDDDTSRDPAALASEMRKTNLFESLLSCFIALTERSPVVVVFEDLHWADSASVEVIDFLARNLGASPLLLCGTYRHDELDQDQSQTRLLAELGRHRAVSQLELTGLDVDATATLMRGILGRQPEWTLLDAVQARSEGNPFFAQELTAARGTTSLPSALRQVIMMRVDQLAPEARHVAAVVAAAGGSIGHRLLADTAELDAGALDEAIAEAVDLHVLIVDDRSRFRFRHALQCDAVAASLLPTERARLHHKLAVALTAGPDLRATGPGHAAVELAEHWWEAGDWAEALPASIAAADAMVALLAMHEAYAHYERALSAYARLPRADAGTAVVYVDLLLKAADAAFLTGAPQRSVELVNLALAEIDETSDPRRTALCFTALGRNAWSNLDPDGAFAAFRRAALLLPSDTPSVELAAVVAEEARSLMLLARSTESEARCLEAITIARAAGARAEESHALCTLGVCLAERGDYDNGIARMRESLVIAEELGEPYYLNRVYTNLTAVLISAGRLDEAAGIVFQGVAQGERLVGIRLNGAGRNSA